MDIRIAVLTCMYQQRTSGTIGVKYQGSRDHVLLRPVGCIVITDKEVSDLSLLFYDLALVVLTTQQRCIHKKDSGSWDNRREVSF